MKPSEYHACNTGDCPHLTQAECVHAALATADELHAEVDRLQLGIERFLLNANKTPPWKSAWTAWASLLQNLNNVLCKRELAEEDDRLQAILAGMAKAIREQELPDGDPLECSVPTMLWLEDLVKGRKET